MTLQTLWGHYCTQSPIAANTIHRMQRLRTQFAEGVYTERSSPNVYTQNAVHRTRTHRTQFTERVQGERVAIRVHTERKKLIDFMISHNILMILPSGLIIQTYNK